MSAAGVAVGSLVCPGDKLGSSKQYNAGRGAYLSPCGQYVVASLVGVVETTQRAGVGPAGVQSAENLSELRVVIPGENAVATVPKVGDEVTATITKVNTRYATLDIVCLGEQVLPEKFQGIIRTQDVRTHNVDTVEIYASFRPGDVVKASVISLGNMRSFYLSTAKNHLGVVIATSAAGHLMVPISWEQMQCPVTKAKEFRKVAKVD